MVPSLLASLVFNKKTSVTVVSAGESRITRGSHDNMDDQSQTCLAFKIRQRENYVIANVITKYPLSPPAFTFEGR